MGPCSCVCSIYKYDIPDTPRFPAAVGLPVVVSSGLTTRTSESKSEAFGDSGQDAMEVQGALDLDRCKQEFLLGGSTSLDSLDDACLLHIFSFLVPLPDLFQAGRVCHRWRHLAADRKLWLYVDPRAFPAPVPTSPAPVLPASVPELWGSPGVPPRRGTESQREPQPSARCLDSGCGSETASGPNRASVSETASGPNRASVSGEQQQQQQQEQLRRRRGTMRHPELRRSLLGRSDSGRGGESAWAGEGGAPEGSAFPMPSGGEVQGAELPGTGSRAELLLEDQMSRESMEGQGATAKGRSRQDRGAWPGEMTRFSLPPHPVSSPPVPLPFSMRAVFPTVADAVAAALPGATILLASGVEHSAQEVHVDKPLCLQPCGECGNLEFLLVPVMQRGSGSAEQDTVISCASNAEGALVFLSSSLLTNLTVRSPRSNCLLHCAGSLVVHRCALECGPHPLDHLFAPIVSRPQGGHQGWASPSPVALSASAPLAPGLSPHRLGEDTVEALPNAPAGHHGADARSTSADGEMQRGGGESASGEDAWAREKKRSKSSVGSLGLSNHSPTSAHGGSALQRPLLKCTGGAHHMDTGPSPASPPLPPFLPVHGLQVIETCISGGTKAVVTAQDVVLREVRVLYANAALVFWFNARQVVAA